MTNEQTRELLELAAKAAGLVVVGYDDFMGCLRIASDGNKTGYAWNPLVDDGDALRLAVKVGIDVQQGWMVSATAWAEKSDTHHFSPKEAREEFGNDPYAATRRAIVRAAAEIGKAMP